MTSYTKILGDNRLYELHCQVSSETFFLSNIDSPKETKVLVSFDITFNLTGSFSYALCRKSITRKKIVNVYHFLLEVIKRKRYSYSCGSG